MKIKIGRPNLFVAGLHRGDGASCAGRYLWVSYASDSAESISMKKSLCAGLLLAAVSASAALAGALEDRQALMKQFNLASTLLSDMARGTTPFNATAANIELQALVDGAARIPGLFPAGSNMDSATAKT